jgi:hypothetical protein
MGPRSRSRAGSRTASLVDLTDSRSLSSIRASNDSPATGRARVTVVLSTGAKVIIPIEPLCTNSELHAEAIRRARQLKLPCNFDNTVLCIGSHGGAIAFGEDLVLEVSDLAEDNTFYLSSTDECTGSTVSLLWSTFCLISDGWQLAEQPHQPGNVHETTTKAAAYQNDKNSQSPMAKASDASGTAAFKTSEKIQTDNPSLATHLSRTSSDKVYIRWITMKRALAHSRLKKIGADRQCVASDTTISQLKFEAYERLFSAKSHNETTEEPPEPNTTVELYVMGYRLSASPFLTLADLQLEGSLGEPLDVFVVLRNISESAEGPHKTCGFPTTERGIATFDTSLKMLLKAISNKQTELQNFLEVLWEVTHFPPAVIALRELVFGIKKAISYAVFAACIREIALEMVPPWIGNSHNVLQASRQVFSWLHSLRSEASKKFGATQPLVHRVQLTHFPDADEKGADVQYGMFQYDKSVKISFFEYSNPIKGLVRVSKERNDNVRPEDLAMLSYGAYEYPCNFYFSLPPTSTRFLEHRRVSILHVGDFDDLLQTTNQVHEFQMVGPLQLSKSAPPVITLDKYGYVSLYDLEDRACEDSYPYTENIIKGTDHMKGDDPGQYLLKHITELIPERKKELTWEVDRWEEDGIVGANGPPSEAIVVCVDQSLSMDTVMPTGWMDAQLTQDDLSRLSETKDFFKNLYARVMGYKLPVHLGLVTYSNQFNVQIKQQITPLMFEFKDSLKDLRAGGNTAIFDALTKAKDMLVTFKEKNPEAKCRIILLTDGQDNSSRVTPETSCRALYEHDIVLDAVVIGTKQTHQLFKVAKHTGGYAFCPQSRSALFQIFLLETFLDIRTRPEIVKVPIVDFPRSSPKQADMADPLDFPPCRPHPNQADTFIPLRDYGRYFTAMSNRSNRNPGSNSSSTTSSSSASILSASSWGGRTMTSGVTGAGRLYLHEVKAMIDNQHDYIDVYVSENNMGFWKVVMQGPPASPYADGTYVVWVELGDEFPRIAPTVRFITPILHPNISKVRNFNLVFRTSLTPSPARSNLPSGVRP